MNINIRTHFGEFLLDRAMLGTVQRICAEVAPSWSSNIHVYDSPKGTPAVPIDTHDSLFNAISAEVSVVEPFYENLVNHFGRPKFTGVHGTIELRGSDSSITIVLGVDERRFFPVADIWTWGNYITFQLRATRIEGRKAAEFAQNLFTEMCSRLPVWYGHAEATEEFRAKNISRQGGGAAAIGVDISKSLPGLYWLNFFGRECVDAIGPERFADVSAFQQKEVDDGIMLAAGTDPSCWEQPERSRAESEVAKMLGEDFFFVRVTPNRPTRSPFNMNEQSIR